MAITRPNTITVVLVFIIFLPFLAILINNPSYSFCLSKPFSLFLNDRANVITVNGFSKKSWIPGVSVSRNAVINAGAHLLFLF